MRKTHSTHARARPTRRPRAAVWVIALLAVSPGLLGLVDDAAADSATTMGGRLPTPRAGTAAVWTGTHAYVFGGWDGSYIYNIVQYDPATDTTRTMSANLPRGTYGPSAVWTGQYAYIFGGRDNTPSDRIVRYDPATDTTQVMNANLPSGRAYTSAAWDGRYAYVFGGYDGGPLLDEIVRYDPVADVAVKMQAKLPSGHTCSVAFWDGRYAYVLGGNTDNRIVRYDPATDTRTVMTATFPHACPSVAWTGSHAFLFGGSGCTNGFPCPEIYRYTPATDTMSLLVTQLPTRRDETSAVWTGQDAYVFGGSSPVNLDEIVRYSPSPPDAPTSLAASSGPGRGEIRLTWQPPANDGGFPVAGYNVYRSTTSGGAFSLLKSLGDVLTYKDSGLPDGATRYYRLRAVNDLGEEGLVSTTVNANAPIPPTPPQDLRAVSGPGTGQITLTWETPSGGSPPTGYRVYRGTASGEETFLREIQTSAIELTTRATWTDSRLEPATVYYYKLRAVTGTVIGDESNEASASTFIVYAAVPDADCTSEATPHVQVCWRGDPKAHWVGVSACDSARRARLKAFETGIESPEAGIATCLVFDNLLGPP